MAYFDQIRNKVQGEQKVLRPGCFYRGLKTSGFVPDYEFMEIKNSSLVFVPFI